MNDDKMIFTFRVMWDGWEMDNVAWVMERPDATRYLRMTSHGGKYEALITDLEELLKTYKEYSANAEKALALLQDSEREV